MKLNQYLSTLKGIKLENQWSRMAIAGLVLSNLLLLAVVLNDNPIITLVPSNMVKEVTLSIDSASPEMHRALGMQVALLLGNVTPQNAKMVKEAVAPMFASSIYSKAMAALDDQILQIKQDKVSTSFTAKTVKYEPETGKTFVTGSSTAKGLLSSEGKSYEKTYEFYFVVNNYQLEIAKVTNYRGKPKDIRWQKIQQQRQQQG